MAHHLLIYNCHTAITALTIWSLDAAALSVGHRQCQARIDLRVHNRTRIPLFTPGYERQMQFQGSCRQRIVQHLAETKTRDPLKW